MRWNTGLSVLFCAWVQITSAIPAVNNPGNSVHGESSTMAASTPHQNGLHVLSQSTTKQQVSPEPSPQRKSDPSDVPVHSSAQDEGEQGMTMMQMVFYGGSNMWLWFKGFKVDSPGEWVAACLGLALMAILYEALKTWRVILANRYQDTGYTSIGHGMQTVLHLVQVTGSYFLMLAVMTYSTWVMMSVCAGAALGYYLFAVFVPARSLLGNMSEHCH